MKIRNYLKTFATCLVFMVLAQWAVAQTAHYTVTFDATWSALTHPTDFPPNPHFSGLVGGTHDNSVSFWDEGSLASLGIKRMAEWGSQVDLLAEVQAAIDAGMAETTIADDPLWTVPGTTSIDIQLTPQFPLVTMVAMIAPSPDWFIGVRNLDLAPGGIWVEELVVDLFAFDSGTDSGVAYTSPDQPTVPPVPVFPINGYPFEPGVPLGTLTFTKQFVSAVPEMTVLQATAYPNPFNPRTTIAWELPSAGHLRVDIYDVSGRQVRHLRNETSPAGPGQTTWDGRNNTGRVVAAGVYYFRMELGNLHLTQKLTLIK
ncbi:MAG: spondin domain-containing protein [Candidatus Krumholzibacteriota bacterium]